MVAQSGGSRHNCATMNTTRHVAAVITILVLLLPSDALPQLKTDRDWRILKQLAQGDKLRVELVQGKTVEGAYKEANDSTLALTVRNAKQEINKGDVNKIYLLSGKPIGSDTGKGAAIGATAGGNLGGAALGDQLLVRVFVAMLFAIPGAIIGLIAGASHHSRQLIYER